MDTWERDQDSMAARQAQLIQADGWMCEQHPGTEWPHDDCAGPGMPWIVEGREAIRQLMRGDHAP